MTLGLANACPAIVTTGTAPVLPRIAEHYVHAGGAGLVPLVIAIPPLMMAVSAPLVGIAIDRLGGRRVLIIATLLFGLASIGCYLAESLVLLLELRAVVGVALAGMVVASTSLLGAYFDPAAREKWLGAQMIIFCAVTIIIGIGAGAVGDIAWRAVFLLGAAALLLLPVYLGWTWEVESEPHPGTTPYREKFPWGSCLPIFATTIVVAFFGFAPLFETGFILLARGIDSPVYSGIALALGAIGGIPASIFFGMTPRLSVAYRCALTGALGTFAFGLLLLPGLTGALACLTVIGMVVGFGLPALAAWLMAALQPTFRGRGLGLFQSALYIGQFAAAPVTSYIAGRAGSLSVAMGCLAGVSSCLTVVALTTKPGKPL
jgi:MFS family permease